MQGTGRATRPHGRDEGAHWPRASLLCAQHLARCFLWSSLPALRKTTPLFTERETEALEGRDPARLGMWTEGPRRLALSLGHVELAADALLSAFLVLESSCWGSDPMAPPAVAPGAAQRPDVQTSTRPDLGPHLFFLFSDKPWHSVMPTWICSPAGTGVRRFSGWLAQPCFCWACFN